MLSFQFIKANKKLKEAISLVLLAGLILFSILIFPKNIQAVDGLMNGKFLTGETDDYLFWLQTYNPAPSPYFFDRFYISKEGKVGINTSTPLNILSITGDSGNSLDLNNSYISGLALTPADNDHAVSKWYVDSNFISSSTQGTIDDAFVLGGNSFGATAILGTTDNQRLAFLTNNTEKMTVLANGNVGIGTTNPGYLLHILNNDITGNPQFMIENSDVTEQSFIKKLGFVLPGANSGGFTKGRAELVAWDGTGVKKPLMLFSGYESGQITVLASKFGLANNKFISATTYKDGGSSANILGIGMDNVVQVGSNYQAYYSGTEHGYSLRFWIGENEADNTSFLFTKKDKDANNIDLVKIDSSGNVGIGTTTPNSKLIVDNGTGVAVDVLGGNIYGLPNVPDDHPSVAVSRQYVDSNFFVSGGNAFNAKAFIGTTDNFDLGIKTNNTENMTILANGNVGIGPTAPGEKLEVAGNVQADAFYYNSDVRLKENIKTLNNATEKIRRINPVEFRWKKSGEISHGFIAQELELVLPELVKTNQETGFKSVEYANLSAILVRASQEQQDKIDRLELELKILKKRLDDLDK